MTDIQSQLEPLTADDFRQDQTTINSRRFPTRPNERMHHNSVLDRR